MGNNCGGTHGNGDGHEGDENDVSVTADHAD